MEKLENENLLIENTVNDISKDINYKNSKLKIEKLIKELNLEEAKIYIEKMVKIYNNQDELFDLYSEILISLNYTKEAKKAIEISIKLNPNSNGDKYMTLGQLFDDPIKKRDCFLKGVEIYKQQLNVTNINSKIITELEVHDKNFNLNKEWDLNSVNQLKYTLSSALGSIAELYMTTYLCDEKNAEEICETQLKEAYNIFNENPDVLIQYANLRILRKRDKEALEFMEKANKLIFENNNADLFPASDVICNLAKNFSELGSFNRAVKLLDIITQLDDQNCEYWYLLAFNHFKLTNYLHSMNCIERLKEVYNKAKEIDEELFIAVKELEDELKKIEKKNGELKNSIFEDDNELNNEECISNSNSMIIDE